LLTGGAVDVEYLAGKGQIADLAVVEALGLTGQAGYVVAGPQPTEVRTLA
jgi:hypothetical protein